MNLDTKHCAETALGKVKLLKMVYFVVGKAVHVHFDGGS